MQLFNLVCPGVFLSNHAPGRGGEGGGTIPCANSDKKMLSNVTKKMVEKNFQICSYRDDDVMAKNG